MKNTALLLPAILSISSIALAEHTVATGYPPPSLKANAVSYSNDLMTNTNFENFSSSEFAGGNSCLGGAPDITGITDMQQCLASVNIIQTSEGINIQNTNFESRFNTIGDYKAHDIGSTPLSVIELATFGLFSTFGILPNRILMVDGEVEFTDQFIQLTGSPDFVNSLEFKLQQNRNTSDYEQYIRMGSIQLKLHINQTEPDGILIFFPVQNPNPESQEPYIYEEPAILNIDNGIPEDTWLKLTLSYDASSTTLSASIDNLETMTTVFDFQQSNVYSKMASTPLILAGSESSQPENPVDDYISDITIRHYDQGNASIHYTMDYSPLSLNGIDYTDAYFISLSQINGQNGIAYRRPIMNNDSYIPIDVVGSIGNSISAAVIDTGDVEIDGIIQDAEPVTAYIYNPNNLSVTEIQSLMTQEFGPDAVIDAYYEDILIAQGQGKDFSPSITLPTTPIAELDYILNNIDITSTPRNRFINKVCNTVQFAQSADTNKVIVNIDKATGKLNKLNKKSLIDSNQHTAVNSWLTTLKSAASINTLALHEISYDLPSDFCSN